MLSQKYNLSLILGKLVVLKNIKDDDVENFLNPKIQNNIPNPFILKDMLRSVYRAIEGIINKSVFKVIKKSSSIFNRSEAN